VQLSRYTAHYITDVTCIERLGSLINILSFISEAVWENCAGNISGPALWPIHCPFDGVWIGNRIYCTLMQLVNTLYKPLSHTDWRSQFLIVFTSRCFIMAFDGGRSPFSGSRNIPGLSYQLLTATAHNSSSNSRLSYSLTHSTNLSCL
jgi:hypothetical protein